MCSKCFKTGYNLNEVNEHKHTHNEDKPGKCSSCNDYFIKGTDIRIHECIQTGNKAIPNELIFYILLHMGGSRGGI